ncbi:MAG: PEP-CTERM sorting domain-containing protein [Pirellulales bacterium]|nr:PEP-CTERM sorting domain-containing protein [Pirellulales bacterium]
MNRFRRPSRSVSIWLSRGVAVALSWLGVGAQLAAAAVTTVGAVPNAPPVGGGAVVGAFTIGDGAFGSVTVNAGTAITSTGGATIGNNLAGVGVVSLTGFGSDWTITGSASDLTLGDEGMGQVTIANSARLIVPDDTFIAAQSTSSGKLVVTGLGSLYDGGDQVTVGVGGVGIVEVLNGGAGESDEFFVGGGATGQGFVTINGELSRWTASTVAIGDSGRGKLVLSDGGRLTSTGVAGLGSSAGSVGEVEISGVGSQWTSTGSSVTLGASGTGSLTIRNGGRATISSAITVASTAASVGYLTVDGDGSRLTVAGAFSTSLGEAYVTVSNGGVVRSTTLSITAGGRVTLAGGRWEAASASNSAVIVSGLFEGSGVVDAQGVTISGGAARGRLQTAAGDRLRLTGLAVNNGLIDLAGGELDVAGTLVNDNPTADIDARNGAVLRVGGAGLVNNNGGQLSITSGVVDVFGAVTNNTGAEIAVVGGSTAVFHDAVTNNGTIFVSPGSEIVTLENLGFVPSSIMSIQLAPVDELSDPTDAHGLVSVGGSTTLAGTLAVSLAGYVPQAGDVFPILRASQGVSGTFAVESLPTLGGGFAFDVQYTSDAVLLAVTGGGFLEADFNQDGFVNGADLTIWKNAYGAGAQGDATGDGKSDGADFLVWQRQFGSAPPAALAAKAAVPEPTSLFLLTLAVSVAYARRQIC